MIKEKFTWKKWFKQSLKGLPLYIAVWSVRIYGREAVLAIGILAIYIGYLIDEKWRKNTDFEN